MGDPQSSSALSSRKAADDFIKYETAEIQYPIGFCCPNEVVKSATSPLSSLRRLDFKCLFVMNYSAQCHLPKKK